MEYGTSTPPVAPAPSLPVSTPPPPAMVVPPPVFAPQPVVTHAVFESKPDRNARGRRSHPIRNAVLIIFLVFILVITVLYFWGAYLAETA